MQRGETLDDYNLHVDVERGEIVDMTPENTPIPHSARRESFKAQKALQESNKNVEISTKDSNRKRDTSKHQEKSKTSTRDSARAKHSPKDVGNKGRTSLKERSKHKSSRSSKDQPSAQRSSRETSRTNHQSKDSRDTSHTHQKSSEKYEIEERRESTLDSKRHMIDEWLREKQKRPHKESFDSEQSLTRYDSRDTALNVNKKDYRKRAQCCYAQNKIE